MSKATRSALAICTTAGLLGGCSSLKVEVGVLDPRVAAAQVDTILLETVLPAALGQSEEAVRTDIEAVQNAHFQEYVALSEAYRAAAQQIADPAERNALQFIADQLQPDFGSTFAQTYEDAANAIVATNAEIVQQDQRVRSAPHSTARARLERDLLVLLRKRQEAVDALLRVVQADVPERDLLRNVSMRALLPRTQLDRVVASSRATAEALEKSILRGPGIADSPIAHAVASAPDSLWATDFNRVFGRGRFGNLDVAVIVDASGDFTLKGMTFDPSAVAQAAAKVTSQALVISAQIAGVPVNLPSPTGPGAALAMASSRVVSAAEIELTTELRRQAFEEAIEVIAAAILAQRTSIDAGGPQAAAALRAIRITYEAQKARLSGQGTSQPADDGNS